MQRARGVAVGCLAVLLAAVLLEGSFLGQAAVTVTVPYSTTPVADADLDGDPGTGAWGDALSVAIPLENGAASPYGSATLYAKHDGTYVYFRIDGSIDVPWTSTSGNYFWLGMQVSPSGTSHHGGGAWDGIFFGFWDPSKGQYAPTPTYPPVPVDTNGFSKPPTKDASQDIVGKMRYSGTAAPYSLTAEWKKKLSTGDANDLAYVADGTTSYNFFVTTDSNGGGSSGGNIDHSKVTNVNTMRFAPPGAPNTPPTVGPITFSPDVPRVGDTITFVATAEDLDGDALTFTWDFADGVKATGTTAPGGGQVSATHAYSDAGDFQVVLVIQDGKGGLASSSVPVSVVIQIEVIAQAPWTQLYVGQTMDLTVTATVLGSPLAGAAVSASVSTGCSLTPTSGTTDTAGVWKTTVKPLTGSGDTTLTVSVSVSKAPYNPGATGYAIYVVPSPLSADTNAASKTKEMMSFETAKVDVRITDSTTGAGVTGAIVTPSTRSGGIFSSVAELGGGDYAFGWSAPKVTTQTTASIAVSAKAGGYIVRTGSLSFLVDPNKTDPVNLTQLYVFGVPSAASLRSGETITVTVYVYTVEGYAVTGAWVNASLRFPTQGTVSASVDQLNGVYTFTYTAATFTSDTLVTIKIDASKYGYRIGTTRVSVLVTP